MSPSIEISTDQAVALARGENITIEPAPAPLVKRFIAVCKQSGSVVEFETHDGIVQPWTVVRRGMSFHDVGYQARNAFNFFARSAYVVTEIPA